MFLNVSRGTFSISFLLLARSLAISLRSERNNHLYFIFVSYPGPGTKDFHSTETRQHSLKPDVFLQSVGTGLEFQNYIFLSKPSSLSVLSGVSLSVLSGVCSYKGSTLN